MAKFRVTDGFFKVHWSFFKSGLAAKLGPSTGWVLMALHRYANAEGHCHPSNKTLGRDTDLSVSYIVVAKKQLQKAGLIDYKIVREGKKNRTYYRLKPLRGAEVLSDVDKDLAAAHPTDVKRYLGLLKKYATQYKQEASYLKTHLQTLKEMKVYPSVLNTLKKEGMDLGNAYLYFALSLVHTLKTVSVQSAEPFPVRVQNNTSRIVQVANSMFKVSSLLSIAYEDALLKFMGWVHQKKAHINLHLGILGPLSDEWARGEKKKRRAQA